MTSDYVVRRICDLVNCSVNDMDCEDCPFCSPESLVRFVAEPPADASKTLSKFIDAPV